MGTNASPFYKMTPRAVVERASLAFCVIGGWLWLFSIHSPAQAAQRPDDHPIPQVAAINQKIWQSWHDHNLTPSAVARENEWCRRVYLDLIGRIPTIDELKTFEKDRQEDRKLNLVNTLLYNDDYTEEYARNWTTIWTNVLIGRNGGNENRSLTSRQGMQKYLRDSFARNKSYDQMVLDLISAEGVNTPGMKNFNGAVNFLANKLTENATLATAQTTEIFLGMQVQCTQCHNHPFNEWKQAKFWEMNAFFRQTVALRRFERDSRNIQFVELANQDFAGESGQAQEAETYYELRNGLLKVAYPVFVDGTAIGSSGYLRDVNRRLELAQLVVSSPYMPQAIVNRMWAHFLGYGFTKPVNDMGPHNTASHPELLVYLGQEFRSNSFDLKQLLQWIVLSQPYSLSSQMNRNNFQDDPELGEQPKFSHFYLRQMRAEELYESLLVATQAHKIQRSYQEQEETKNRWLRQFTIAFGTDEGDETTTFNGTIPQALMLFNGDLMERATSADEGGFLNSVATSKLTDARKIQYLYRAGLARRPSGREIGAANQLLAARLGNTTAALQDVWWAILNSNEFILNH